MVLLCNYTHIGAEACGGKRHWIFLELEFLVSVGCLTEKLEIKLQSSANSVSDLHQDSFPPALTCLLW